MSDAIADAARLLLTEASPETVRAVLRLLVNDVLPAAPAPVQLPPASPPRPVRKRAAQRALTNGVDAAWEALRREVRGAMRERGVDYATLGAAIGRAPATLQVDIGRRRCASQPLQAKLRAWLAETPKTLPPGEGSTPRGNDPGVAEVAEAGSGFRSNSAGSRVRNNGIGQQATSRLTPSVGQQATARHTAASA